MSSPVPPQLLDPHHHLVVLFEEPVEQGDVVSSPVDDAHRALFRGFHDVRDDAL